MSIFGKIRSYFYGKTTVGRLELLWETVLDQAITVVTELGEDCKCCQDDEAAGRFSDKGFLVFSDSKMYICYQWPTPKHLVRALTVEYLGKKVIELRSDWSDEEVLFVYEKDAWQMHLEALYKVALACKEEKERDR